MSAVSFSLTATVRDAFRDVLSDIKGFFKITWVIWLLLVLCVEVPMGFLTEQMRAELGPEMATPDMRGVLEQSGFVDKPEVAAQRPASPSVPSSAAASVTTEKTMPSMPEKPQKRISIKTAMLVMLVDVVQVLLIFSFAVAWYRALLLHEKRGLTIMPRLGRNEWNYAWTNMKAGLVLAPLFVFCFLATAGTVMGAGPEAAISVVDIALILVALVALFYLQARLALAYPATAIGETQIPLKQAWELSRGQGWQILAGNLLIAFPLMALMLLLVALVSFIINALVPAPDPALEQAQQSVPALVTYGQGFIKILSNYFILVFFGVLSAFHARVYATLVRGGAVTSDG